MSKRHSWKKNPNHFLSLDFFFRNDAYSVPEKYLFKNSWPYIQEKSLDFFPEMTLTHFPKSDFWNFGWIFFSKNDAYSFPGFWIFFPRFTDRG